MTTTAYDTAAILRQNVADLERELQRQRGLADNAIAEARADLQDWIESRNEWMARAEKAEAELKGLREQEPVAWMLECQQWTGDTAWLLSWSRSGAGQCNRIEGESHQRALYTRPIPAPAPSPVQWMEDEGDNILVPRGLLGAACSAIENKRQADKVLAALRHYTQSAAPAVPGPYLLGGRRFKISINGEGGFYGFEGFPELNGQWVALVDATDNQHMQSAGENP